MTVAFQTDVDALARQVPDGAKLALPPEYSYVPMALVRALVRRGVRDLDLLCVPIGGMAADILIGAGCVARIEAAAVSLGEAGPAPRFTAAFLAGEIAMTDSTCPAVHTALQAAEKGVPFMPLGGIVGSDIARFRDDWKVVDDPTGQGGGPVLLVPAIRPDVAILHSPMVDRAGNVWIGRRRELATMAHAAKSLLVTAETIVDDDLLGSEASAAATLPAIYVTAVAEAKEGAKPLGLAEHYAADAAALAGYARAAKTREGFDAWLEEHVLAPRATAAE